MLLLYFFKWLCQLNLCSPVRIFGRSELFVLLISFWIFVTISHWENNEVKCTIINIQNVNAAGDCERTLNRK